MTASTSQPLPDLDPESVHQVYLGADVRPAISAASQEELRVILNDICGHLCRQLGRDMGKFPALGPDRRRPWEICQVGGAMAAGFQLHQHIIEAVTGSYLHALGFDPARASTVAPYLATARRQALRRMLLRLNDYMRAVLNDSDTYAQAGTETVPELDGDMWEIGGGRHRRDGPVPALRPDHLRARAVLHLGGPGHRRPSALPPLHPRAHGPRPLAYHLQLRNARPSAYGCRTEASLRPLAENQ